MQAESAAMVGKPRLSNLQDVVELGQEVREQGFKALKTNIFVFDE